MAAPKPRSRSTLKTAAVLFLPAACVLAVWYAVHEPRPEALRPNELAPSEIGSGFSPQVGLSTPLGAEAEKIPAGSMFPEAIERGEAYDALQARMKTLRR